MSSGGFGAVRLAKAARVAIISTASMGFARGTWKPARSAFTRSSERAYPNLLILDELGHLPLSREEASLFFPLLVRRCERGSLVVTSNQSFADWGEVFNDHVLTTAILDRLLHHATTLNITGESYRVKGKRRARLLGRHAKPEDEGLEPT